MNILFLKNLLKPQLLVAFLFVLTFSSCSKDSQLGGSVIDASTYGLEFIDTFQVKTSYQTSDSIKMYSPSGADQVLVLSSAIASFNMVGGYNNAQTGTSKADFIFNLSADQIVVDSLEISSITIDSAVMAFQYTGRYGYSDQLSVDLYKLAESLDEDQDYYSNTQLAYESQPIGSVTTTVDLTDSVQIDSLIKVPAQLRVNLDLTEAQALLSSVIDQSFEQDVNGFALSVNQNSISTSGSGLVASIDALSSNSGLFIYFTDQNGAAQRLQLIIEQDDVRFNTFEHDFNTTIQANLNSANTDFLYVKSMLGLTTKIELPTLKDWLSDSLFVAQALMTFKLDSNLDITEILPHGQLLLVERDAQGDFAHIKDADLALGTSFYDGQFDLEQYTYTFNITRYLQNKIEDLAEDSSLIPTLYLVPEAFGIYDPAQIVIDNNFQKPTLKIYYTQL